MNTTEIRMIIISWIITWQQTGQPRRNGISRNVQPSKTEPEKNKNLKRSITCNKIQSVFHKLPINKRPRPVGFWGEFYHTFKEGLIPILFKVFQKFEKTDFQIFHEASTTLIPKSDRHYLKK